MYVYTFVMYVKIGDDIDPLQLHEIQKLWQNGFELPTCRCVCVYFLCALPVHGKQMFTPSTLYILYHCLLSVTGVVAGVLHFSALYCMCSLSIAIWSKQHCVSCAGTGAWLFRCSLYRRPSQSERPARAGLSCECSGQSEYNGTVSVLKV